MKRFKSIDRDLLRRNLYIAGIFVAFFAGGILGKASGKTTDNNVSVPATSKQGTSGSGTDTTLSFFNKTYEECATHNRAAGGEDGVESSSIACFGYRYECSNLEELKASVAVFRNEIASGRAVERDFANVIEKFAPAGSRSVSFGVGGEFEKTANELNDQLKLLRVALLSDDEQAIQRENQNLQTKVAQFALLCERIPSLDE
jgi:hypothetical protein